MKLKIFFSEDNKNLVSNYFFRFWSAFLNIIALPIYVKYLGAESFGYFGFYTVMYSILVIFDFGLCNAMTRFVSSKIIGKSDNESRNKVNSFIIFHFVIGLILAIFIYNFSKTLCVNFLKSSLNLERSILILKVMSLLILVQWPANILTAIFIGLNKQVLLNIVRIILITLQIITTVIFVVYINNSILVFFSVLLLFNLLTVIILFYFFKNFIGLLNKKNLRTNEFIDHIKSELSFSFASFLISILSLAFTQFDKVYLLKHIDLKTFGYYSIVVSIANAISGLATPIFNVYFPILSNSFSNSTTSNIETSFHKGAHLLSLIIIPICCSVFAFPKSLLNLWFHDPNTVNSTYLILKIFIIGTLFNNLMLIPLSLQMAFGKLKISIYKNIFSLMWYIPLLYFLINNFNVKGAAYAWLAINLSYILYEPILIDWYLKLKIALNWYLFDVAIYFLISTICILTIYWINETFHFDTYLFPISFVLCFSSSTLYWIFYSRNKKICIYEKSN